MIFIREIVAFGSVISIASRIYEPANFSLISDRQLAGTIINYAQMQESADLCIFSEN
ncbi:hypothetical protein [Tychonema sp. LEGE 07203]|uniref:hypothetical protein n=1 Tax=Tychonema sp. LEGE 07203 TaxID=1828671 RepID=UPI00187E2542|nr:hypothetical protein [Tychonema sp. LEGE 07203]MBE9094695.1 hypothetical protein [Tychonema sp. LEGE 07203]